MINNDCSVCLEIYYKPVTLGCAHSICLECYNQIIDLQNNIIKCPLCRNITYIINTLNYTHELIINIHNHNNDNERILIKHRRHNIMICQIINIIICFLLCFWYIEFIYLFIFLLFVFWFICKLFKAFRSSIIFRFY
jgi:hypothetical protein